MILSLETTLLVAIGFSVHLKTMFGDKKPVLEFEGWPKKAEVYQNGDIMLGALMMVHERANEPLICGQVMPQGGVQALEAMLYTIDHVNENKIIPGTTLGALILDDCDKDTIGLQKAVRFIKGNIESLSGDSWGGDLQECIVKEDKRVSNAIQKARIEQEKPITGVIAAASSVTSIQVANLLKLFKIPQLHPLYCSLTCDNKGRALLAPRNVTSISNQVLPAPQNPILQGNLYICREVSFFSTSSELNQTDRFPYFFRTIPSDEYQVLAIVDLIRALNWTYVSVVYEESSYGKTAFELLERFFANPQQRICIAVREKLPKDSDVARDSKYEQIVTKLTTFQDAKGVVVYGSDQEVQGLMRAVTKLGHIHKFQWIGSDGWSARQLVYEGGYEEAVLGTISFQPMAARVPEFEEYFENLTPHNNLRNPWFYEFWESEYKCRMEGFPATPHNNYSKKCTGLEHLGGRKYNYEKQLQFVMDAVQVFAHALRTYFLENCQYARPHCIESLYPKSVGDKKRIDGERLRDILQKTTFEGLAGNHFKFKGNGGPTRYNILHFRKDRETGKPVWVNVGNYTEHGLMLELDQIETYTDSTPSNTIVKSVCSVPCKPGHRMVGKGRTECCWSCELCLDGYYLYNSTHCQICPRGSVSSTNRERCIQVPIERTEMISVYGIISLAVALFGVLITVVILLIFLRYNDTPIVKASGRELSYVIICGLFLCFGMTPLMLQHPSQVICGLQRVLSGFCFTIVYAALLTKTNRIARIFRSGKKTTRVPTFISPQSQLVICGIIASVQIFIVGGWMYARPPVAVIEHPTHNRSQLVCKEAISYSYLLSYAYPILLCIICTIYACQTRKIPEAFNESKYIGAAVYTTCIIWLAFVPIYFAVKDIIPIRITSVCISTSLTAIVCQACLYLPKLYIILIHPERNIRQNIMSAKSASTLKTTYMATFRSDSSSFCSDEGLLEPLRHGHHDRLRHIRQTESVPPPESKTAVSTQTSPREILRDSIKLRKEPPDYNNIMYADAAHDILL